MFMCDQKTGRSEGIGTGIRYRVFEPIETHLRVMFYLIFFNFVARVFFVLASWIKDRSPVALNSRSFELP